MTRTVMTIATLSLVLSSCGGTTYDTQGTDFTRGTDAEIEVTHDDGGNHRVSVTIEHLPPAARLEPGTSFFVVWSIPPRGLPQHIGSLDYDEDSRVGELETVTPYEVFEILITAETDRVPASPSEHVVVRQAVTHD